MPRKTDPTTEAALEVVRMEQALESKAMNDQAERERLIAECHQVIGRVQANQLMAKFGNVASLVYLKQVKDSKIYKDLPGIGTWDLFCESIGLARRTVDEDLLNLSTFGEDFLETCCQLQVGYRDLKKLRKITHEGTAIATEEGLVIGDEIVPYDDKEEFQAAIERLLEERDRQLEDAKASLRANEKVLKSKADLLKKQEKALARFEQQAEAKGLTPEEDAFVQKCENARITIDGFLNQFDPDINPLPDDATERMKNAIMHTLSWFKRCILTSFDTAADLYGLPDMDDGGGWTPPHLQDTEPDSTSIEE